MNLKSFILIFLLVYPQTHAAEPNTKVLSATKITLASSMNESFEFVASEIDGQTVHYISHATKTARICEQVITEDIYKQLHQQLLVLVNSKFKAPCTHPVVITSTNVGKVRQNLICAENKKGQLLVKDIVEKAKGYLKFQ